MKPGDKVKFDNMGNVYEGVVLEVTHTSYGRARHNVVRVKSENHRLDVSINVTLFPGRVRKIEESKVE